MRRYPKLPVYVHERGAPHMIDPTKLMKSATQLYGDDMDRLWGEMVPVPEENIRVLSGGEMVEGLRVEYTPGHASHHVTYFDEDAGDAYVGDVGGVRIPPSGYVAAPTPPPDIDLEKWSASLDLLESRAPQRLRLTHFGCADNVAEHITQMRGRLAAWGRGGQVGGPRPLRGRDRGRDRRQRGRRRCQGLLPGRAARPALPRARALLGEEGREGGRMTGRDRRASAHGRPRATRSPATGA